MQQLVQRLTDKLSQGEIARRTNIPQPRLSRWVNGDVPESVDDVFKLQKLEQELAAGNEIRP